MSGSGKRHGWFAVLFKSAVGHFDLEPFTYSHNCNAYSHLCQHSVVVFPTEQLLFNKWEVPWLRAPWLVSDWANDFHFTAHKLFSPPKYPQNNLHRKTPDNHTFPCRGPCGVTHSSEPVQLESLAGWGWETNALFSHKPLNLLSIEGSHGNASGMQRRFWEDLRVRWVYSRLYKCILVPGKCSTRGFILKL